MGNVQALSAQNCLDYYSRLLPSRDNFEICDDLSFSVAFQPVKCFKCQRSVLSKSLLFVFSLLGDGIRSGVSDWPSEFVTEDGFLKDTEFSLPNPLYSVWGG